MRIWGTNPLPGLNYAGQPGAGMGLNTLNGFEMGVMSAKHVRDSFMTVLEFKPNDSYHGTVDLYYSKFRQSVEGREFQANLSPPDWSGIPGQGTFFGNQGVTTQGDATYLTGGNWHNEDPLIVSRGNYRKFKLCRVALRDLASSGQIPGMTKASW